MEQPQQPSHQAAEPAAAPASAGPKGSAVPAPTARKLPPPPKPQSPFVYLGIPQFVLDWRPSRPGPKMSAFLAVTTALTGAYVYDRRECARLQREYIDQVKWMAEQPLQPGENARVVRVLGARVPEDADEQRSTVWFKRYMRPILLASGTDYVFKIGSTPGGLGRLLLSEIRGRRILDAAAGAGQDTSAKPLLAVAPTDILTEWDTAARAAEGEGGTVVLGRYALKEYLWALKKGYGEPIDLREEARLEGLGLGANERRKDGRWEREEELLVRELEREDAASPTAPFAEEDLPAGLASVGADLGEDEASQIVAKMPVTSIGYAGVPYKGLAGQPKSAPAPTPATAATATNDAPLVLPSQDIPPQPPLLLVPFTHTFGVVSWLPKLLHFWNHRTEVRYGGEMALALLTAQTRPLEPPTIRTSGGEVQGMLDLEQVARLRRGEEHETPMTEGVPTGSRDLDFMAEVNESPAHFRRTYRKVPVNQEYTRRTFYSDELGPKLKTARELARGEREPTSAESKYPPKVESELRRERLEKELRWRRELEGWAVQRSGSGIAWDDKWAESEGKFKVYEGAGEDDLERLRRGRDAWQAEKARRELERDHRLGSD